MPVDNGDTDVPEDTMADVNSFIQSLHESRRPAAAPTPARASWTEDPVNWGPTTSPALGDAGYQVEGAPYSTGKVASAARPYPYLSAEMTKEALAFSTAARLGLRGLSRAGSAISRGVGATARAGQRGVSALRGRAPEFLTKRTTFDRVSDAIEAPITAGMLGGPILDKSRALATAGFK